MENTGSSQTPRPSIVLVHGAWHGPWCWDALSARLTENGYSTHAVRLRGHDHRPGRIWSRISHYLEDVRQAVADCEGAVVLVGHSLGAYVVQRYLETARTAGAVLLAPVPPIGSIGITVRYGSRHPATLVRSAATLSLRPLISTVERAQEMFFTPDTPPELVESMYGKLQDESWLAFAESVIRPVRRRRVQTPMLVLGAGRDAMVSERSLRSSARAYGTEAESFSSAGHNIMLGPDGPAVAKRIDRWIRDLPHEVIDQDTAPLWASKD